MTKIFAHRGYSFKYPENTMIAFKKAIEYGADGIECDIQRTKDGVLVISHDEDLERIVGEKLYIKDLTYNELLKYNFGNKEFYETLPTLENLIKFLQDKDILLNIELKTDVFRYSGIERQTLYLVKKYNFEDRVIFSSFNFDSVKRIINLGTKSDAAYLVKRNFFIFLKAVRNNINIHPSYKFMESVPFFYDLTNEVKVRVWTINDENIMEELIKKNIDSIITNKVELALDVRSKLQDENFTRRNN